MNEIINSIHTVVLEKLKQDALGHNNTEAWIENGVLYIDSMKNASAFNDISKLPNVKFEVVHRANEEQYRWAMTGEGKFNTPTIGGRETICNVYKVTLK
jgi:hypothetical protein